MKKGLLLVIFVLLSVNAFANTSIRELNVMSFNPQEFKLTNENPEVIAERNAGEEQGYFDQNFSVFGYYAGETEVFQKSPEIKDFYEIMDRLVVIFKQVAKDEHIGVLIRPDGVISIIVNEKSFNKAWMDEFAKNVNRLIKNSFV